MKFVGANLASYPSRLSRNEVARLLPLAKARKGDAAERLLAAHWQLVLRFAKHYTPAAGALTFDDLCQWGAMGVLKAIDKYSSQKGAAFITYAYHWIRQCVHRAVQDHRGVIRIPAHLQNGARRKETADTKRARHVFSLDEPINKETSTSRYAFVAAPVDSGVYQTRQRELAEVAETVLALVPEKRLREVYRIYFWGEKNMDEVGQMIGVSGERIRQMMTEGYKHLRKEIVKRPKLHQSVLACMREKGGHRL